MEPLRIEALLSNRMAAPRTPIHLDALLAYAQVKTYFDPDEAGTEDYFRVLGNQIPVARHEAQGDWFFKASVFMPVGPVSHSSEFFTQRMDQEGLVAGIKSCSVKLKKRPDDPRNKPENLPLHGAKIDVVRGVYRNMLGFYGVTEADRYQAFCVGDREEIESLLASGHVNHLGPRRGTGYGAIAAWRVIPDESALERCYDRVRHIQLTPDDQPVVSPIRPPYWDKSAARTAYCPPAIA